jgi:CheY-like chemotaxis protein
MEELPFIEESDGKGALAEYKKDKEFGMVIIEWDLMGMDGLDVVKEIGEYNKTSGRDCYIIMISERSGKWDIQKAVEMGVDDFLTKPYNSQVIHDRIRSGKKHLTADAPVQILLGMDPKHLLEEHEILRFQAEKIEDMMDDIDEEAPKKLVDWMSGRAFVLETELHQDKEASYSVSFLDRITMEQRVKHMAFTDSNVRYIEMEHKELEKTVKEVRQNFTKLKEDMETPGEYEKDFNIMDHTDEYPAYCLKDKEKVEIVDPKLFKMENGVFAFKGYCPKCSTSVTRIIGKSIGISQKYIVLKKSLREYLNLLRKHLAREEKNFFPFADRYLTPADSERLMEDFKEIEDRHGISRLGKHFKAVE